MDAEAADQAAPAMDAVPAEDAAPENPAETAAPGAVEYGPPTSEPPLLPITLPRTLRAAANMTLDARTLFVCSYPKSGTTWMQFILYTLCTRGKRPLDHISTYAPFLENDKSWVHEEDGTSRMAPLFEAGHADIGWRIFNTHLWWETLPQDGDARYVYVMRSGKDVAVSFWQHLSHQAPEDGGYEGSWEEFFADWCAGRIAFGLWPDHLKSFLLDHGDGLASAARDPRILVVSYEQMKADISAVARRIVEHCRIEITDEELAECIPCFDISYMKQNNALFEPKSVKWVDKGDGFQFVRKGATGDHQTHFSEGQSEMFDEMVRTAFPRGVPTFATAICD